MKNTATLWFFLLLSLAAKAQYIPMLEESKYWIHYTYYDSDHPNISSGHLITIDGDTLILNLSYKKIWIKGLKGSHPCPPSQQPCFQLDYPYTTTSADIVGFAREDLAAQKVYFLPAAAWFCQTLEYELFDFSLLQGDALNDCLQDAVGTMGQPGYGLVDSLTTEEAFGKIRRVINTYGVVTYNGLPYSGRVGIYEGIGFGGFGLFHRYSNLTLLHDFCEGNCNILSATDDITTESTLEIFPNPAVQSAHLKLTLQKPARLSGKAINSLGQSISLWDATSFEVGEQTILLDGPQKGLCPGLWYIQIMDASGNSRVFPWILMP